MKLFRRRTAVLPALTWAESAGSLPRATLDGRSRALIENHSGIIEFTEERLRLASQLGEIVITGTGINLAQVREGCLIVQGRIDSVIMPDGGKCDGC